MSDGFEHGEEGAEEQLFFEGAANEEEAQGATSQATESTTQSKSKRGTNKVPTESWVVTKLNKESYPEESVEAAEKFSNTCNAIVLVRARIYQRWSDVPEDVKQYCYEAAWKRFVSANDEIRRRLEWRMHQVMRKGQSTWQYNCKKLIGKDRKTVVNKHWKGISEEDWERFKVWVRSRKFKASQKWYKELREKRPFDHRLGSRGCPGKEKVWAKEDAALDQAGIQPRVPTLLRGECSSKWLRSSMTANQWAGLEPMSEKQEAALVAMAEWESDGSHSSINQQWDDAISYALQRDEHGGHMRGVGSGPFRRQMAKEQGSRKRRRASSKEQSSEELDQKIRVLAREELRKLMRHARDQRDVDNFIDHGVFPPAPIQPTPPTSDPSPLPNKSTSCSGTECQFDPLGPPDENLTKGVKCRLHIPTVGNSLGARGLLMPRMAVVHHVTLRDDMVRVQVDSVLKGFEDEPEVGDPRYGAFSVSISLARPRSVSTRPASDVSVAAWRLTRSFGL
ncbi:hypothetical protein BRADI_1g33595v3 [Brachypodium distachyon]|uniref:DUF8039 domain-containing protein n=1 Tax=Brachypodium distachyon TaxID=15368 RepID=A0A0Q3RX08_BRADI|nr:hypothetical protein BRADI_1g33595v3 [Brachypodium distachyon]